MTVSERIRELRKEKLNLTLERFGERIGLTKQAINMLEAGRANLTDQTRMSICREFGVNEEWLLTGQGEPFPEKSRHDEIADFINGLAIDDNSFKARFITALTRLSENEWLLVEKVVRQMSEVVAPVQQDPVINAEEEYIKSSSENVPPTEPAASKSIAGEEKGETA